MGVEKYAYLDANLFFVNKLLHLFIIARSLWNSIILDSSGLLSPRILGINPISIRSNCFVRDEPGIPKYLGFSFVKGDWYWGVLKFEKVLFKFWIFPV